MIAVLGLVPFGVKINKRPLSKLTTTIPCHFSAVRLTTTIAKAFNCFCYLDQLQSYKALYRWRKVAIQWLWQALQFFGTERQNKFIDARGFNSLILFSFKAPLFLLLTIFSQHSYFICFS